MTDYPLHIVDHDAWSAPVAGPDGIGSTRAADIWKNAAGNVRVGIWKAEPGRYGTAGRPYAETFIVIDGEADVTVGEAPPRSIGAGAIVHVPAGTALHFDVRRTLSKFSTNASP